MELVWGFVILWGGIGLVILVGHQVITVKYHSGDKNKDGYYRISLHTPRMFWRDE